MESNQTLLSIMFGNVDVYSFMMDFICCFLLLLLIKLETSNMAVITTHIIVECSYPSYIREFVIQMKLCLDFTVVMVKKSS